MRSLYFYFCVLTLMSSRAYPVSLFSHRASCAAVLRETGNRTPEGLIATLLPLTVAEGWRITLRAQFAQIFARDVSDEQKIQLCLASFYRLRLSLLDQARRHELDRLILHSKTLDQARWTGFRHGEVLIHHGVAKSSPMWLVFMVHELEHAIQHLYIPKFPYHSLHPRAYLKYFYLAERGAKMSEGLVMLALPDHVRDAITDELQHRKALPRLERQVMRKMLAAAQASVSVGAYIDHGPRYSKAECALKQAYDNVPLALGAAFIAKAVRIAFGHY